MNRTTHPDRNARSEPFEVFTRPQRSRLARLLGLIIRLRAEIVVTAALIYLWTSATGVFRTWAGERPPDAPPPTWFDVHGPALLAGVLFLLVAGTIAAVPLTRRYTTRRALAVLTRHRLRAVFVQRRVMNWTGNLPLLLWSRPTPVGERVWVLLRAGIDGIDVERNLAHIASGCLARDARVTVVRAMTALIAVDVVRRDPLRHTATDRPRLRAVPTRKGA